jgi:acetyl esterase
MSLWGYNAQATEDALRVIARSVTERDVEIATLRRELAELRGDLDGARAAGIGGPRVSPPALPARAREAYRPGLPGQAGPSAGDNDPESTITSVPGGQAQRASLPGAAATQPGGQAHDAGLPGAPGQADPPGPVGVPGPAEQPSQAGVPGQADPPGQATELPFWAWQRERGTDD